MLISWLQIIFSSCWLSILIVAVHTFKKKQMLKLIVKGFWVIAPRLKLKNGQKLAPSLQNQTKKELDIFVVSYSDISPSSILELIHTGIIENRGEIYCQKSGINIWLVFLVFLIAWRTVIFPMISRSYESEMYQRLT